MRRLLFASLLFVICLEPSLAESYKVSLEGDKLKGLAALEIKLLIEPKESFLLSDDVRIYSSELKNKVELKDEDLLYKFVDPENALIRLFFRKTLEESNLYIEGDLNRTNFSGRADITIGAVNYISDFAREVEAVKIKSKIDIIEDKELLPFLGISKAVILGPKKRIYRPEIFVAIGDIETYGFTLGGNIAKAKINGVVARIINNETISTKLALPEDISGKQLDLVLEIEVDNKIITKSLGTISIIEAVK